MEGHLLNRLGLQVPVTSPLKQRPKSNLVTTVLRFTTSGRRRTRTIRVSRDRDLRRLSRVTCTYNDRTPHGSPPLLTRTSSRRRCGLKHLLTRDTTSHVTQSDPQSPIKVRDRSNVRLGNWRDSEVEEQTSYSIPTVNDEETDEEFSSPFRYVSK